MTKRATLSQLGTVQVVGCQTVDTVAVDLRFLFVFAMDRMKTQNHQNTVAVAVAELELHISGEPVEQDVEWRPALRLRSRCNMREQELTQKLVFAFQRLQAHS